MSDDLGTIRGAIELDLSQVQAATALIAAAMATMEQSIAQAGVVTDQVSVTMTDAMTATAEAMTAAGDAAGATAEGIAAAGDAAGATAEGIAAAGDAAATVAEGMTAADESLAGFGKSAGATEGKITRLTATLELQERMLAVLRAELAAVDAQYGTDSTQAERARIRIEQLSASVSENRTRLAELNAQLNETGQGLDETATRTSLFGSVVQGVAQGAGQMLTAGLAQAAAAVAGLGATMISSNAQFEQYAVQFGVLLKSPQLAQERLAELADFAQKTPFELPGVIEADKILQGFGLHSAEAAAKFGMSGAEIRTIAGDTASYAGVSFGEMANYLGQFSSGATGDAIARFQELGITTRDELAQMGLEFSKSGELTSPLPQAMTVLLQILKEKYGGMMAEQSQTFDGMASNLSDWVGTTTRTLGAPIFDALKGQLNTLMTALNSDAMASAVTSLAAGITTAINAVGVFASALRPAFEFISSNAVPAMNLLTGATIAWAIANAGQAALAAALITQRIILATAAAWANVAAMVAAAAATIVAAAPWIALAAAIAGTIAIWQKYQGLADGTAAANMSLSDSTNPIGENYINATKALTAFSQASAATQKATQGQADSLKRLQDEQKADMELRARMMYEGKGDAAWWDANNKSINERAVAIRETTNALQGNLDLAAQGKPIIQEQSALTAAISNAVTIGIGAVTQFARDHIIAGTDVEAKLRMMANQARLTAAEMETLTAASQKALDAGRAAFSSAVSSEVAFGEARVSAAQDHAAKLAKISKGSGGGDGGAKAARDNANKQSQIEEDYAKKSVSLAEDTADRRTEVEKDYGKKLAGIAEDTERKRVDVEKDYGKKRLSVESDTATKRAELAKDYTKKLASIEEDFGQKRAELATSYADTVAEINKKKAAQLVADLKAAWNEGVTALGDVTTADITFLDATEKRRTTHVATLQGIERDKADKLAALERDYRDKLAGITGEDAATQRRLATQDYAQKRSDLLKASDDKITTETATFAESEAQAALAYANEQAKQSEHLGRMLIQYTMAQGLMKGISKDRIEAMTGALADEYGVQTTMTERSFGSMRDVIDQWAGASGASTETYTAQLGGLREEAVRSQQALDKLIADQTALAQADFTSGKIGVDDYLKRLQSIPKQARTELGLKVTGTQIDTSTVGVNQAALDVEAEKAKEDHYKALAKLESDYSTKMRDAAAERNDALAKLADDYTAKMQEAAVARHDALGALDEADALKRRDAAVTRADALTKLDEDYAKRTHDAATAHADALIALDKSYRDSLAQQRSGGGADQAAAEEAAFAASEQRAAEAYAREQAAQLAHLGQMLIDYVKNQGEANGLSKAQIAEMTASLAAEYGVQTSLVDRSYDQLIGKVNEWMESGGKNTDAYLADMKRTQDGATATQKVVNAKYAEMIAAAKKDFEDGKLTIDEYSAKLITIVDASEKAAAALNAIPKRIDTEVVTTYRKVDEPKADAGVNDAPAPEPSAGPSSPDTGTGGSGTSTGQRALGGPVRANSLYEVAERGRPELLDVAGRTYLMMGAQSGQVIPAMQSAQASLAAQGAAMAQAVAMTPTGTPTALPRGSGGITINVSPVFNGTIVDNESRIQQLSRAIVDTARTVIGRDFSDAVTGFITAGGLR